MWPKIKFCAEIFVTEVISKFIGKISRRTIIPGQHGRKQGRKTIRFEALLRNGSKVPKRGHG
jgi:hypothetical protein